MTYRIYSAILDREPGEESWSVLFPDFPEIASMAETDAEVATQAFDALATAIDARREDGKALPEPTPPEAITQDWQQPWRARVLLVPIAIDPSPSVRINITVEKALLQRVDAVAEQRGMTRSGFLSEGARRLLNEAGRRHRKRA